MPPTKDYLYTSDRTRDAALAHVTAARSIGSTTLSVDTVVGWPTKFIATSGTVAANGYIDPNTATKFYGRVSGGNLLIDGFCAGSVDNGNTEGQLVMVKPMTDWADIVAEAINNLQVSASDNLLQNGAFINNSTNGYGVIADDWANSSANPVQGGFPSLTKQEFIDITGVADASIKGFWPLNGDFNDYSGNGYNLTASGGPTNNDNGLMGQAKTFAAASSQYAMGSAPAAKMTGSQTFFCYVNLASFAAARPFMGFRQAAGTNFKLFGSNGVANVGFRLTGLSPAFLDSDVSLKLGKWNLAVGVYDSAAGKLKVWVNGIKKELSVTGTPANDASNNFSIGRFGEYTSEYFDGSIQMAGVLSVALTDDQVKKLWAATSYQGQKIRRASTNGYIYQTLSQEKLQRLRGKQVTLSALGYQSVSSIAQISIYDGTTETSSSTSTTTAAWLPLTVTATIPTTATEITVRLKVSTTNGSAWFRNVSLVEGAISLTYKHSPEDNRRFPRLLAVNPPAVINGHEYEEKRWYSFTPTISASDSMTVGTPSNYDCKYMIDGTTATLAYDFLPTIGGTLSYAIYATSMVNLLGRSWIGSGRGQNSSGFGLRWDPSTNKVEWRKYDGGNLSAGSTFFGGQIQGEIA